MFLNHTQLILKLSLLCLFLTACSNNTANQQTVVNGHDSLEKFNRKVHSFNEHVDHLVLKPVAQGYKAVTPKFVDTSLGNFFSNLGDVGNAINNTLQGKFSDAVNDTERFVMNSTFGFAGLVDVASSAGIKKSDEDFGQTLAKWGVKSGPYVVLPILGPSTVRDAGSRLTIDRVLDPANYSGESTALLATKVIKTRADYLNEEELLNNLSDDKYAALRDVWLQNRDSKIRDGKVDESTSSDLIDELESLDAE